MEPNGSGPELSMQLFGSRCLKYRQSPAPGKHLLNAAFRFGRKLCYTVFTHKLIDTLMCRPAASAVRFLLSVEQKRRGSLGHENSRAVHSRSCACGRSRMAVQPCFVH